MGKKRLLKPGFVITVDRVNDPEHSSVGNVHWKYEPGEELFKLLCVAFDDDGNECFQALCTGQNGAEFFHDFAQWYAGATNTQLLINGKWEPFIG